MGWVVVTVVESGGTRSKYQLECVRCRWCGPPALRFRCPLCAGALEPRFVLAGLAPGPDEFPEAGYFDLLPVDSMSSVRRGTSRATVCRPAPRLGAAIGAPNLWVKDESAQPTGSTKDRLAAVVVAVFRQYGVREFATSSTGNTAVALARAVEADATMRAHFFCGRDFASLHAFETSDRIGLTVIDGGYAEASEAGRARAEERGILWEGGFFNWARREGLKLAYLESFDAMDEEPAVVVQAVSSGMGMMAAYKGAGEYRALGRLARMPRFLMAQQDTCAPMANGWRDGRHELDDRDVIVNPTGLAQAILLGDARASYPYMREIAEATGGSITAVGQPSLVHIRRLIRELEDLEVGYSAAVAVAAVGQEAAAGRIDPGEVVLVNLTGGPMSARRHLSHGRRTVPSATLAETDA
jgi:threonine synthase